jgi:peptidoglycan hydrolase-like protein with peptidoglycan-binding domain
MSTPNTASSRRRVWIGALALCALLPIVPVAAVNTHVAAEGSVAGISGLSQGARGDAVKAVQQALTNQGVAVAGGIDGIFGAGTAAALKQFQTSKGLAASGVVDDATALALGLATSPLLGLTQGTRGDAVKQLQQKLVNAGIAVTGGADGVFGAATSNALKLFQTNKGLGATGTVDAATAAALGSITVTTPPASNPPANGGANPLVGLKIGSKGDAVKQLQQQLIKVGFNVVGGADGVFGVLTANALSSFQNSVGLTANALANEATVTALATAAANAGTGGTGGAPPATSPLLGLKAGATGDAVKQLQQTLITAGVAVKGGADGKFGTATQTALKQYQAAVGIAQSGVVDQETASALASGQTIPGAPTPNPPAQPSGLLGLKAGSLGTSVKQLQEALIKAGVTVKGGADGIFGPATSQALKAFQTSQGLTASGVVDDVTVAALQNPKAPVLPPDGGSATGGYAVYGEKGTRVIALQNALAHNGITVRGGVDGDFGANTTAAVMDFQHAKGLPATGKVDDATALALGLAKSEPPAAVDPGSVTLSVFPVQGRCYFADTFGYARSGGRTHLGVDIIAAAGLLEYAVADGTITKIYADYPGSLSGNGVRVTTADGTYYFYAHMTGIATGIAVGTKVKAGQIVGTVGMTGNAGTNHLHFEIHPKGGAAINPYPVVKAIDACNVTTPLPQP